VVFNEMQRQFAMLTSCRGMACHAPAESELVEQYARYTYPYRVWQRIDDVRAAVRERRIAGIIHYVQSFCFRAMEDVILREQLDVPMLTLEGDRPGPLDARSQMRLESFLEMLG
jgi:benzoyl-CoA reductase/2-hydroxyglutaryl-CoA dehydratase subunit BcrC/BadD/HgdB